MQYPLPTSKLTVDQKHNSGDHKKSFASMSIGTEQTTAKPEGIVEDAPVNAVGNGAAVAGINDTDVVGNVKNKYKKAGLQTTTLLRRKTLKSK